VADVGVDLDRDASEREVLESEPAAGEPPAGEPTVRDARRGKAKPKRRKTARRLFDFDRAYGVRLVAGADEAGRGSLAGPLVAAAVLFDYTRLTPSDLRTLTRLNDSKQQTVEGREELYPLVLRLAARVAVVSRCVRGIDSRGLHKTNLAALRDSLRQVARPGCMCLTDGFPVADFGYPQQAVIGGDGRSAAIAAASIVAKVSRDRYMHRIAEQHELWDFGTNVGYSTPEHRDAIARHGITPLHRLSFQSIAYHQLTL
jgi:ribonuclease HII